MTFDIRLDLPAIVPTEEHGDIAYDAELLLRNRPTQAVT